MSKGSGGGERDFLHSSLIRDFELYYRPHPDLHFTAWGECMLKKSSKALLSITPPFNLNKTSINQNSLSLV